MEQSNIDWARVEELRDEVGSEDFIEITALFLSEIEEALASLPATDDTVALTDAYHGMKGSALNLGFTTLAERCAHGEAAPTEIAPEHLAEVLRSAKKALRTRFPELHN